MLTHPARGHAGEAIGGDGAAAAAPKYAEPTLPKAVQAFTSLITDSKMFDSQLAQAST